MTRDTDRLTTGTFDLLVIGGGIYGLTIAYDAAQRGLTVALIEQDDFGSGATFNHLRTIHGGLRYLQSLDITRARQSVLERRRLATIAPHAVEPLPFALPLYRSLVRGKAVMRAGFLVDRVVSAGRNRGLPQPLRLPAGRVVSRTTAIQRYPGLRRQGLRGAAVWHDYLTLEPDRLTFTWALAAAEHGTVLANHVEALEIVTGAGHASPASAERRRVSGVRAHDLVAGRSLEIGARIVVNATGRSIERLVSQLGASTDVPMIKAMNVVTRRDAGDEALGGIAPTSSSASTFSTFSTFSPGRRALFMVPWRERALFGTWESGRTCDPADTSVAEGDVAAFLTELNQAFPALDLTLEDVTLVHRGVVPAVAKHGKATLEGHDRIIDHAVTGGKIDGLISVAGAKYTTARAVAQRVTDMVLEKLERPPVPCRTDKTVLPGGSVRDPGLAIAEARREHDVGLPSDTIPHLIAAYGSRHRAVLDLADQRSEWRSRVAPDSPVIAAQLVLAARQEMAVTLGDALIRRTPVGALGNPGDQVIERAAALVGGELGWSEERRAQEIAAVKSFYRWR